YRLVEDRYVKTDSTHGMDVWRLDLPLSDADGLEREALLWDLAGQMGYLEIHQLFLDQTALGILLVNLHKDNPFAEAGDWLSALKSGTQDIGHVVAKLLIATRQDVGGSTVSNDEIRRFLRKNGFRDWL